MKYKVLSIIIPSYNEEQFIINTLNKVIRSNSCGLKKEIIIIDDASTDSTVSKIKNQILKIKNKSKKSKLKKYKDEIVLLTRKYSVRLIMKSINHGKGSALQRGFLAATGDIVLVQDADLEYDPEEYPILLDPFINHDADVVYGSRFVSYRPHRVLYFWHFLANILLTTMSNMFTNLNLTDMETGFKVFRGDIIRSLAPQLKSKRFGFEPEITAKLAKIKSIKIYEVGISYWGRTYEEGKKIGWKDGLRAIWEIIKYNVF